MMAPLDPSFEPTEYDVICARGRTVFNHEGNRRFRGILEQNLHKYQSASTKQQKTTVVNKLLDDIKEESRFVRKLADGKWVEVQEHVAKEKIGQGFRDLLHAQYRSSTKSKVKLRRERRQRQKKQVEQVTRDPFPFPGRIPGYRPTHSSDTFEPLPLDESTASTESLIYDCPPFDFPGKDETKTADVGEEDNLDAKPKATEGGAETSEKIGAQGEGEPQEAPPAEAPCKETAASSAQGGPPAEAPPGWHPSWDRHQEPPHYHEPPPQHHYETPPDYHYPRYDYYSPSYSPSVDYRGHPPPPPRSYPPPPPPALAHHRPSSPHGRPYPPPPPPAHHHRPSSPQGGPGRWAPYHYSYGGEQSGYCASPAWSSYDPVRGYALRPAPSDYYYPPGPASPPPPPPHRHDERGRGDRDHGYHYPSYHPRERYQEPPPEPR